MLEHLEELLKQAQEAPDHYFGSLLHLEEDNQARTGFAKHRDSDILAISNYETVLADLKERFGAAVEVNSANHWAVGWIDEIVVKARNKKGRPHPAFIAAMEWHDKLADYPCADERDYSRREYEDLLETLENCYDVPTDKLDTVSSYLFSTHSVSNSDDLREEYVEDALQNAE